MDLISKFFYNLFWLPARLTFKFFLNYKVESLEDLSELKSPLIIAANHQSFLDSFLIGAALPFNAEVFPIHYACWYKYYYSFFPLIRPFGPFPVRKGIGLENSLKKAIKILSSGGTIGIYPEGKRRHLGRPRRPRRGAPFLALKTNSPILPVYIKRTMGTGILGSLLRKREAKIIIGRKFFLPEQKINSPEDLNKPAQIIGQKIIELQKTKEIQEIKNL